MFTKSTTITISNTGNAEINIRYSDGTEKIKVMPVISLCRLLQSLELTSGQPLGEMPAGYVMANYADPKNFSVVLKIPELNCPVQYMGKLYKSIPYPELCFALKYNSGLLNESRVYAVRDENTLCYYPYGNVYESGKICWGGYQHKLVDSIKDSELTAQKFYELPTNNDLWSRSHVNHDVGVLSNMYEILEGKHSFPSQWLVPIDGVNINGLLNYVP